MAHPRHSRSTVIVVLLVATLAMSGLLAYEANQAARSHRAAAENVLRDYAAFAAWELSRTGRTQVLNAVQQELQSVSQAIARHGLTDAIDKVTRCGACANSTNSAHKLRTVFTAPFPSGVFTYAGQPVDAAVGTALDAAVRQARVKTAEFTCPAFRVVPAKDGLQVVVWKPEFDAGDRPVRVVGFVAEVPFLTHVFARVVKQNPLLPPSLVAPGGSPNAALAVRVATPEGHALFTSAPEWSSYEAREQLSGDLGALSLAVALKPDAAGTLVIGGLPRERLPLLGGMLALTVGLVVVALVQLRREAELSRLRSEFVSGVSHELRTPLAQIRMFTETLLLGRVRSEHEGRRSLEIIARESQRLAQLVENVLLFARGERTRQRIAPEAAPLAPLVADVVESFAPLAAARRARIVTDLDDRLCAKVDAGAVRQILLNLLDNAVKYGPEGQTVAVALHRDGDRARLVVDDCGPGIDVRERERIFQPFTRLSRSADATGGAGIGLAIVRELAELHGGRASVEPAPGGGARFAIEIPGAWTDAPAVALA